METRLMLLIIKPVGRSLVMNWKARLKMPTEITNANWYFINCYLSLTHRLDLGQASPSATICKAVNLISPSLTKKCATKKSDLKLPTKKWESSRRLFLALRRKLSVWNFGIRYVKKRNASG